MDRHKDYTALLTRHHSMLWHMCWNWAKGNRDRCCDLLQEVSLALWENFDKLRPGATPGQERAWVRWQARSVFFQINRRKKPDTEPLTDAIADNIADENSSNSEILDDLMAALDPDERQMLQLYLDGFHGEEIGRQMAISRNTYYQKLHRAILKMRRVSLIVLVLILTSATAIAIVPQWRHFFFDRWEDEKQVSDTIPQKPDKIEEEPLPSDSVPQQHNNHIRAQQPLVSLEQIAPLDILDIIGVADTIYMAPKQDSLSISLIGNRLTITGAKGEIVRLYDLSGHILFWQEAEGICIIDIIPNMDFFSGWSRNKYILEIGKRTPIMIQT